MNKDTDLYGFEISTDEIKRRKEDITWFVNKTRPLHYLISGNGETAIFIYADREQFDRAYETASIRYETLSDAYRIEKIDKNS